MQREATAVSEKVELQSLADHIDPRDMGSRAHHRTIAETTSEAYVHHAHPPISSYSRMYPQPKSPLVAIHVGHVHPTAPGIHTSREDLDVLLSHPITDTAHLVFDALISMISQLVGGDEPEDVVLGIARGVIQVVTGRAEEPDVERKARIEKFFGPTLEKPLTSDQYSELLTLATRVVDYGVEDRDGRVWALPMLDTEERRAEKRKSAHVFEEHESLNVKRRVAEDTEAEMFDKEGVFGQFHEVVYDETLTPRDSSDDEDE